MSNYQEKLSFTKRLKLALENEKHPISPTYLSTQFNHRYSGTPISVQSANNWLSGKAIPSQDKLSILAVWLNVSTQWLRFGDTEDHSAAYFARTDTEELDLLLKLKKLTTKQKNLIESLIDEFIQKS